MTDRDRFTAHVADDNLQNHCMHLTNYAINKNNDNFEYNTGMEEGDKGSKRHFSFLNDWLKTEGHRLT
eukprot:gene24939-10822_t